MTAIHVRLPHVLRGKSQIIQERQRQLPLHRDIPEYQSWVREQRQRWLQEDVSGGKDSVLSSPTYAAEDNTGNIDYLEQGVTVKTVI